MVIRFFIPDTTANDLRLRRIFYPRLYPLDCISYLNSSERASIILVPFLLRLWYDEVLVGGLNPGPPALEAGTLPIGHRGGGDQRSQINMVWALCSHSARQTGTLHIGGSNTHHADHYGTCNKYILNSEQKVVDYLWRVESLHLKKESIFRLGKRCKIFKKKLYALKCSKIQLRR